MAVHAHGGVIIRPIGLLLMDHLPTYKLLMPEYYALWTTVFLVHTMVEENDAFLTCHRAQQHNNAAWCFVLLALRNPQPQSLYMPAVHYESTKYSVCPAQQTPESTQSSTLLQPPRREGGTSHPKYLLAVDRDDESRSEFDHVWLRILSFELILINFEPQRKSLSRFF